MQTSDLFKFTCLCLLPDKTPELKTKLEKMFSSEEVDLDQFIHLCSNHLVIPLVYRIFQSEGILNYFPREYKDHLREIYQTNKNRNIQIIKQIHEICAELNKENIEPIFLKGTANLLDGLYFDPGDRMIGDIDFIVKEENYIKTAEIIINLGYKNDTKVYDDVNCLKHYPRLFRNDVPADIEVHRLPVPSKYLYSFNTKLLFREKKNPSKTGIYFVTSNLHKTIHTFIHGHLINKGYLYKSVSLRDLYDSFLQLKRIDLNSVLTNIEDKKRAQEYFDYVQFLFNSESNTIPNRFAALHQWFLNHPVGHHLFINIIKTVYLLFIRYTWRIIRAPFQKSSFQHIYKRLKDPEWYKIHLEGIIKYFS